MSAIPPDSPELATLQALLDRRYSCRAYRADPVPRVLVERALAAAQRTPSWCNTQPWQVHVASGAARDRLMARYFEVAAASSPASPDFAFPPSYEGVYRDRRKVCGVQLYQAVGIGRDDRERAHQQSLENFRGFGAPHVAILTTDRTLGVYGLLDCGIYLSNLMLALGAQGIDCIAQAALATYPQVPREHFGIGDDRLVVCGLSFGYGQGDAAINGYRTARAAVDEVLQWSE